MGRESTTHFNPALGVKYVIINKNGEKKIAKTLGIHDKKYAPIRSQRDTPKGNEFFKMLLDDTIIVFNNSLQNSKCLSDGGEWEFVGERPDGSSIEKKKKKSSVVIAKEEEDNSVEFVSTEYRKMMG